MKENLLLQVSVILITALLFCTYSQAATYINQTRLIMNEKSREVTFSIINDGNTPVLMQLWSERDNILERPEAIKMPFIILPPVFRLEARTSRTVRLQFTGNTTGLARDRESLFWLSALEVPPRPVTHNGVNVLQMAFRTRIKLFYRPDIVAETTSEEAIKKLHFSDTSEELQLQNRSPLHISLLSITLGGGTEIHNLPGEGTIAPFSTLNIPQNSSGKLTSITWIDDFGVPHVLKI